MLDLQGKNSLIPDRYKNKIDSKNYDIGLFGLNAENLNKIK